jgi:hypothetical protein
VHFGYAPTQTIQQVPAVRRPTAAAAVVPGTVRQGTWVTYSGSILRNHGPWNCDGPCPCGCGGLSLRRQERDGVHRLAHVSPGSVTRGTGQ